MFSAIILAAGRGERMGELTKQTPKPLLSVKNRPLMEYVIRLLSYHGIRDIAANLCYRADAIEDYFASGNKLGVKLTYVREAAASGTAGGILAIAQELQLSDPFLVISADMLINFDLSQLVAHHRLHNADATLSCYFRPREQLSKSGIILFHPDSTRIEQFIERPAPHEPIPSQWVNSSVYCFSHRTLAAMIEIGEQLASTQIQSGLDSNRQLDLGRDVFPILLARQARLFAKPFSPPTFYQLGIDTPERIAMAEDDIDARRFEFVV